MAHKASFHDVHRTQKHLFEVLRRPRGGAGAARATKIDQTSINVSNEKNRLVFNGLGKDVSDEKRHFWHHYPKNTNYNKSVFPDHTAGNTLSINRHYYCSSIFEDA